MGKVVTFYIKDFRGHIVDDFIKYLQQLGMRVDIPHVNVCNKALDTKGEVKIDIIFDDEKRGRWIKQEGLWNKNMVKCSLCGNYLDMNGVNGGRSDANFCPNCGARMDGDTE